MAEFKANSVNWKEGYAGSTESSITMTLAEEVPTLTVATILGVTVVVLFAIVVVFVLGILIDCRQQRLLDSKIRSIKRLKIKKTNSKSGVDVISIANNMEAQDQSLPPSEVVCHSS